MARRSSPVLVVSILLTAALLAACSPPPQAASQAQVSEAGAASGRRSIAFVPNLGQTDPTILFRVLGSTSTLFFARREIVLPLPYTTGRTSPFSGLFSGEKTETEARDQAHVLRLRFEGTSVDGQVVGQGQLAGTVNYYLGDDPAEWRTDVPTYETLAYEGLYAGIDLVYGGGKGFLKGTYVVAPGANPGDIRWRYEGATRVALSEGELLISVGEDGEWPDLVERQPSAWQTKDGARQPVSVGYALHRDGSVGFRLGRYDRDYPLVIDPALEYGTYWGDTGCDGAYAIDTDPQGKVYIAGRTNFQRFPPPTPNCDAAETFDFFVTKLDPSQTGAEQHVYTTYIGGSDVEHTRAISVDDSGNAYVAGFTWSSDFPTTPNAYQRTFGGWADGVMLKLDAGGAIQYATLFGGSGIEEVFHGFLGEDGLLYAVGMTDSADLPTTEGAFQRQKSGTQWTLDSTVTVVDPSASGVASLVYSTYYGGSEHDEGFGIAATDGIITFAGYTASEDLPLENPIQDTNRGGETWGGGGSDGYLARLDPSLSGEDQLLFATYFGGSGDEWSSQLVDDGSGVVTWVGGTGSADFPTTDMGSTYGGGDWDGFLAQIDTVTPALLLSRLVGGSGNDGLWGVAVDDLGNIYASGGTGSRDFPTVAAVETAFLGGVSSMDYYAWYGPGDMVVTAFDPLGNMTFGTYLSGSGAEAAFGIALDTLGNVYVAGGTESADLAVANPFQSASAGSYDVFVAGISGVALEPTATFTPTDTPTATPTVTPTPTSTPTPTPTPTATATPSATPTATPTDMPTATPTATPPALYLPLLLSQ